MSSSAAYAANNPAPLDRVSRIEIDLSARPPVMTFWVSSFVWLLWGTVLAIVTSIKLHAPAFLAGYEWLTFGRTRAAHLDTVVYGFAGMSAVGTLLWLQARLCQVKVPFPRLLTAGALVWNLGLVIGNIGLLAGYTTGVELAEFPIICAPFFALPFVLVAVACFRMYAIKQGDHTYVSQWYLLAVVIWFPILYLSVLACTVFGAVGGVSQAIANWWFGHNVIGLFVTPTGVAAAYYLIPKVTGKPVHSYHLSLLGFWTLAIFYNWAGTHHLTGGPIPAWAVTIGIVGSMMMFVPVVTVAINHHMTMKGSFHLLKTSPTLRFTVFGSMMYTVSSFQGSLESLRSHQEITHFTHYTIGHAHLGLYGFYAMILFAAMYYVFPRLTGNEWSSAGLIKIHFWTAVIGTLLYGAALCWSGWWQGVMMKDPSVPFLQIVEYTKPYLILRSLAGVIILAGSIAFAINLWRMIFPHRVRYASPTLFTSKRNWKEVLALESEIIEKEKERMAAAKKERIAKEVQNV